MSFFDFESSFSTLAHDRRKDGHRKDERAALAVKLKAKLKELQDAGLDLDLEDDVMADETMHSVPSAHEIVAS